VTIQTDGGSLGTDAAGYSSLPDSRLRLSADFADVAITIDFPNALIFPQTYRLGDPVLAISGVYGSGEVFRFSDAQIFDTAEYEDPNRWLEPGGPGTGSIVIQSFDNVRMIGTFQFRAFGLDDADSPVSFRVISGAFNVPRAGNRPRRR
jgi:hypothetical protein